MMSDILDKYVKVALRHSSGILDEHVEFHGLKWTQLLTTFPIKRQV